MTVTIDARGLTCPEPLKLLARSISNSSAKTFLVETTDPVARIDIPAWCHMRKLEYRGCESHSDFDVHTIVR